MSSCSSSSPSLQYEVTSSYQAGTDTGFGSSLEQGGLSPVDSIINMYIEKPLPLTPAKPPRSPLSNMTTFTVPPDNGKVDKGLQVENVDDSFTSPNGAKVLEQLRIRPGKNKGRKPQALQSNSCDEDNRSAEASWDLHPGTRIQTPPASREPIFREWMAPRFSPNRSKPQFRARALSKGFEERSFGKNESKLAGLKGELKPRDSSRRRADEYRALLHDVSPESPRSNPFSEDSSFEPSPMTPVAPWSEVGQISTTSVMSSRINDVLDQPPMPEIDIDLIEDENAFQSNDLGMMWKQSKAAEDSQHPNQGLLLTRKASSAYSEANSSASECPIDLSEKQPKKSLRHSVSEAIKALNRSDSEDHRKPKSSVAAHSKKSSASNGLSTHVTPSRLLFLKKDRLKDMPQAQSQSDEQDIASSAASQSSRKIITAQKTIHIKRSRLHERREELKKHIKHVVPRADEGREF